MPEVIALQSFEHGGTRRRGDRFEVSDAHAAGLIRNGLVKLAEAVDPSQAAGEKSSASQAAQASAQQTSKPSVHGGGKKKGEQ